MRKLLVGILALTCLPIFANTISGTYTGTCSGLETNRTNNVALKISKNESTGIVRALLGVNFSKPAQYMNDLTKEEVEFELIFKNISKGVGVVKVMDNNRYQVILKPHPSILGKKNKFIFSINGNELIGQSTSDPMFRYKCEMNLR